MNITDAAISAGTGDMRTDGQVHLHYGNGSVANQRQFSDTLWHQVVLTRKTGAFWKSYVDGQVHRDFYNSPPDGTGNTTASIGSATGGYAVPGDIPIRTFVPSSNGTTETIGAMLNFGMAGGRLDHAHYPDFHFADFRMYSSAIGDSGVTDLYNEKKDLAVTGLDHPGTATYYGPWA